MIKIENITKKFGKHISLDNINLTINNGDSIALMGANGAGKTTLVRSILGYYHTDSGEITIDGLNPIKHRVEVLEKISFVPQLPPPIKLNISELLQYVQVSTGTKKEDIIDLSYKMKLDIKENLNKSFFSLSGGMKQKLLIAISLARKSKIIIYDEPTANLDPKARDDFYSLLQENSQNKILLFVTHRIEEVKQVVNRQIYMDIGKIISDENY
ncbi:MAG: ABC transporter ATP-binding protein [Campylobacteraceae bacterium 4484_166]|nr:MAG: ABC transporter ATP-binding protein [Campylobacteraceae bacterium 4484_166]